jgi:N-acetylmuramoyl-L-alanine amidase
MIPILVIDAGHGGSDPGAICNLFKEKDMTLQIALYQYSLCVKYGIPTVLTRNKDVTFNLGPRAAFVKNSGAKYCLSNHINSFENASAHGEEVIYSIYSNGIWANDTLDDLAKTGMTKRKAYTMTYPGNPKLDYLEMNRDTGNVQTITVEYGFLSNPVDEVSIYNNWRNFAGIALNSFIRYSRVKIK